MMGLLRVCWTNGVSAGTSQIATVVRRASNAVARDINGTYKIFPEGEGERRFGKIPSLAGADGKGERPTKELRKV